MGSFRFFIVLILVLALVNTAMSKFCSNDQDCEAGDCCLRYAVVGWCSTKVNEVGSNCGGKFKCGCIDGLKCVPWREKSVRNTFKIGTGQCSLDR